jgi:hypothetical protein
VRTVGSVSFACFHEAACVPDTAAPLPDTPHNLTLRAVCVVCGPTQRTSAVRSLTVSPILLLNR